MEHPAGMYKRPLLALRMTQMIVTLARVVLAVLMVVAWVSALARHSRRDPSFSHPRDNPAVRHGYLAMIAVNAGYSVIALACFITCTLWLVFTANPSTRARSCGGNKPACMRYSCDMGLDIFWAIVWGVNSITSCIARSSSVGMKVANIATAFTLLCLFVTTAIISSRVRKNLRVAAAPKVIAAWGSPVVPPIVMGAPVPAQAV